MGWAGLSWAEVVVVVVEREVASDANKQSVFGTIPDFHRVQMLGVGDCSWYGDMVGGGVSTSIWPKHL